MKRYLLFVTVLAFLVSVVAVGCGEKKADDTGGAGGGTVIATGPTFSQTSVIFPTTGMGQEATLSFRINYSQGEDFIADYVLDNAGGVFKVTPSEVCPVANNKITVKNGGCDVNVVFAPTADEPKNYVGSMSVGSLSIQLSGGGKNQAGELPPTVDATVNLGLILYYNDGNPYIAYERINEEVITVKNKTNASLAIPLTATAVPNFQFRADGVKVKLDTDKFEPDSCFNDNDYRSLGTSPALTKKLSAGESCRFSVSINVSTSDIATVIQGAKMFTITAANDGVKDTEYIAMFNALRSADKTTDADEKKQTYNFGTAKVGTESLLFRFYWGGQDTELLTAVDSGKVIYKEFLTFSVDFFTNFVIDKQLTTCDFMTTATTTVSIPLKTPRCNVFFRFKPAAAGEITATLTRANELEVLEEFKLGDTIYKPGKSSRNDTKTFKGTGN